MHQQEGAGSSAAARFLAHITSRRHRVYGLVGVALVLVSVAFWMYGGFATGIDFITSRPSPPEHLSPATPATGAHGANGGNAVTVTVTAIPNAASTNGAKAGSDAPAVNGGDDPTHDYSDNNDNPQQTDDGQNNTSADDPWRHSQQNPAGDISPGIPKKIWQILLPKKPSNKPFTPDPKILEEAPSWLAMNPDYAFTLVGQKGGDEFVRQNFGSDPRIVEAYNKMPNVGMKSDLLRYLLLSAVGGVYTDTDTVALKPIDQWVPEHMRDKVAVVVGIEFDRRDGGGWADIIHWVQFCQWTIAAAPGHPVFRKMVLRILDSLNDLSAAHNVPVEKLKPTSFEVMNSTGPAAFSEVVFKQLQEYDPSLKEHKDLSFMTEPRLIGNILVLTIDGFGMGQIHSKSTHDGSIPDAALVKHLFKGGWRGSKRRFQA